MKKIICAASIAFTLLLGFLSTGIAQANDSTSLGVTRHTESYSDTNHSNWGLLGLIGLLGLAGLSKKKEVEKKIKYRNTPNP